MGKSLTNVETYLIILFIFILLVSGLIYLGNETIMNENANLDNDSMEYIANLNGINISEYYANKNDIETPVLGNLNYSAGSTKDDSLGFLLSKEKGFEIEIIIKRVLNLPSFIWGDLLRLPINEAKVFINIIGWILNLLIIIALIYFARGLINR